MIEENRNSILIIVFICYSREHKLQESVTDDLTCKDINLESEEEDRRLILLIYCYTIYCYSTHCECNYNISIHLVHNGVTVDVSRVRFACIHGLQSFLRV
jgi:hypothetical protein